jgi:hypothetical protein
VRLVPGDGRTPVPRQEVVELAHWVSDRHAFEDVLEISEGLDIIELGGGDEGANCRPALGAAI